MSLDGLLCGVRSHINENKISDGYRERASIALIIGKRGIGAASVFAWIDLSFPIHVESRLRPCDVFIWAIETQDSLAAGTSLENYRQHDHSRGS
jgi:hypothetical protein